jgi:hypothetical protein
MKYASLLRLKRHSILGVRVMMALLLWLTPMAILGLFLTLLPGQDPAQFPPSQKDILVQFLENHRFDIGVPALAACVLYWLFCSSKRGDSAYEHLAKLEYTTRNQEQHHRSESLAALEAKRIAEAMPPREPNAPRRRSDSL